MEHKRTGWCSKPMTRAAYHVQIVSGSVQRDRLVLAGAAGGAGEAGLAGAGGCAAAALRVHRLSHQVNVRAPLRYLVTGAN